MKRMKLLMAAFGVAAFALLLCWTKTRVVPFNNGGFVRLKPASFLGSVFGAKCTLTYKKGQNDEAHIDLLQTFWKWPVIVIPSTNCNVFLCIYDNDVDVQLLRIDPSHPFKTLPSSRPLSRIVLASSCEIDEASGDDLDFAINSLKIMPTDVFKRHSIPNLNFGIFGVYGDPRDCAEGLEMADEIVYPGDVVYPDPHQKGRWVKHPKP